MARATGGWRRARPLAYPHAVCCHDVGWLHELHGWPGLAAIGKVEATRWTKAAGETAETRHYVMSAPLPAADFECAVRAHWAIGNSPHWVLDVTLNEDAAHLRCDAQPQGLRRAQPRGAALARPERRPRPVRQGFHARQDQRAGWDDDFLLDMGRAVLQIE